MHYAQKAIDLEPNKPEGYYYYGLSVGIYADGVSVLTALREGLKIDIGLETTETEESRQFNEILRNQGAKAAIAWRDRRLD